MKKITLILIAVVFLSATVSCMSIQGESDQENGQPTLGKELIDLKKAWVGGAISKKEYRELKEALKKSYE